MSERSDYAMRPFKAQTEKIMAMIGDFWEPHQFAELLTADHPQLNGLSILEALCDGKVSDVEMMLQRLEDGAYI